MNQRLIFSNSPGKQLDALVGDAKIFLLADSNTAKFCVPELKKESKAASGAEIILIHAGDENKNLETLQYVWQRLSELGAARSSILVNVGGGMVCDLGGFAASTFKRGIRFINIPSTLLAAVDASVGGKTGINFNGLKNEIGTFAEPLASIISSIFFPTLSHEEILSGYGEMLKHELLNENSSLGELLNGEADQISLPLIEKSVKYKAEIVEKDFKESGLRRALNFGHTAGHAFEALAMERNAPMAHGHAVAHGCVVALVLSHMKLNFPSQDLYNFASYVRERYPQPQITCDDYPELLQLMAHDKKNPTIGQINFTLLEKIGNIHIDCIVDENDIRAALDIYRDLMGI